MTATWQGVAVPDELWNTIIGGAYGDPGHMQVPPALLVSMSWFEVKWQNIQSNNRGAPNSKGYGSDGREKSWGYWQLNEDGEGYGYTPDQLLVPSTNRFITVNTILGRLRRGRTLAEALAPWTTAGDAITAYLAYPIVEVGGFS